MLFKTMFMAKLDKFPVYTSLEHISVVLQTLNMWVCVVYRTPFIDGISGGTFLLKVMNYLKYLLLTEKDYYYLVILTFTLTKTMIPM